LPLINGTSLNTRKGWGFRATIVCTMLILPRGATAFKKGRWGATQELFLL